MNFSYFDMRSNCIESIVDLTVYYVGWKIFPRISIPLSFALIAFSTHTNLIWKIIFNKMKVWDKFFHIEPYFVEYYPNIPYMSLAEVVRMFLLLFIAI